MVDRRSPDPAQDRPEAPACSRQGLTRKQAEAELPTLDRVHRGDPADRSPSVAQTGERLVRALEAQGRKASTLAAYESTLRAHLVPHLGDRAVHRITTEDVEAFVAVERAKGCAPTSIRNYLDILHSILDFAKVRQGAPGQTAVGEGDLALLAGATNVRVGVLGLGLAGIGDRVRRMSGGPGSEPTRSSSRRKATLFAPGTTPPVSAMSSSSGWENGLLER